MRLLHLSDLHFGHHDPRVVEDLAGELAARQGDLIVISGDFTQIGSRSEFIQARQFLDKLSTPVLAVPGNHDVPAVDVARRFIDPYGYYKRFISPELEPFVEMDGVAIAGLKTGRRVRMSLDWAQGIISREQLNNLEARFETAAPDAVRIVVAHHPLLEPEGPMLKPMKRVDRADRALETFARLGVRLVLSGHFHVSYMRRHDNAGGVTTGEPRGLRQAAGAPILVVQASSAISTRLRGEANAYNVIDISDDTIAVVVREWRDGRWADREQAMAPA